MHLPWTVFSCNEIFFIIARRQRKSQPAGVDSSDFLKFSLSAGNRVRVLGVLSAPHAPVDLHQNWHDRDADRRIDGIHDALEREPSAKIDQKGLFRGAVPDKEHHVPVIDQRIQEHGNQHIPENERDCRPDIGRSLVLVRAHLKVHDNAHQKGVDAERQPEQPVDADGVDKIPDHVAQKSDTEGGHAAQQKSRKEADDIGERDFIACRDVNGKTIDNDAERDEHREQRDLLCRGEAAEIDGKKHTKKPPEFERSAKKVCRHDSSGRAAAPQVSLSSANNVPFRST